MTPDDDLTRTSPPDATRDHADAALDAGLAEAFGGETTHVRPAPADPQAGAVIAGKYRLGEKIGEGGMGSVWVASQTEPVKRKVAVKLIKAGMDSKAVLARFEAERQALAVMDHPNIARVLDGGLHEGRPYFVMELVKGVPITDYCDARKLTPQQRLELFVPVCQAIQHAHQKGVIHRDIKPSNVLVALYDDKPVPKVIDFGIAKATGPALTDRTLETGFGAVVGTPQYMSPEQASLNNLDIDTRSDVYSLGVLLYELLTGSPPFSKGELERKGLLEVLRVVREEEPPRPSVKLSTAETLPSIAAVRGTEPKKLTGLLRSELDWIVMKALEKDRVRRYETANGFAADVQRFLAGEPVHAHPPSVGYRLRKWIRKHNGRVLSASAFLALLVAAVIVSSWLAVIAKQAEATAENRRIAAEASATVANEKSEAFLRINKLYEHEFAERLKALRQAEFKALNLQVDLDLVELGHDPRVGLLRLARTLRQPQQSYEVNHPQFDPGGNLMVTYNTLTVPNIELTLLQHFMAAAVLHAGQELAPLLRPADHNEHEIVRTENSPDSRAFLTLGRDNRVCLWESATARRIATLKEGDERLMNCGFSSDGRTAFTDDREGVIRLWDVTSGRLRVKTKPRPHRYQIPESTWNLPNFRYFYVLGDAVQVCGNRILTKQFITRWDRDGEHQIDVEGPVDLWNAETGDWIRRLDEYRHSIRDFKISPSGRWITSVTTDDSRLLVFSAEDGRLVGNLTPPNAGRIESWTIAISPSGHQVACSSSAKRSPSMREDQYQVTIWDTTSWKVSQSINFGTNYVAHCGYESDNLFVLRMEFGSSQVYLLGEHQPRLLFECGRIAQTNPSGDLLLTGDWRVFDVKSGSRLIPPSGHRFPSALARFATNRRFVEQGSEIADLTTEKVIPIPEAHEAWPECRPVPWALLDSWANSVPAEQIELWAQVAVRGELSTDGSFVKWDETTWEKKRQELAAVTPPKPDLPFPGFAATHKLHWLRVEFSEAMTETEKLRLANELLKLAEKFGDRAETVRWRAEVQKRTREILPPPRADK